ncbi:substrate-binding domain-containing protein [Pararhizobium sp.]|uniref:substrate-binding domain-containing protein n=1 Tax=Pararhizobium sp. TaxID=1977563 RepID=UPI002716FFE7|nr:substrate-binding domain-containing protein [Pararhizobium sp.]MDO9417809.1 substrate-binding domain-containing protein [Pararhizobium sp.]
MWKITTSFVTSVMSVALLLAAVAHPAQSQEQPVVAVIVKDQSDHFWKIVLAGAQAAGKDLGLKVLGQSGTSESDVAGQVKLLQDAVKSNSAGIVIAPTQYTTLGPAVDEAARHVPVVTIDSSVASLNMKSTVATDNVEAGGIAADALAKAIAAKYGAPSGEVVIVNFIGGTGSLIDRSKGFKDRLFEKYPDITVIDERDGDGAKSSIEQIVTSVLKEHPDIRGVFASNLNAAEAMAAALKTASLAATIKLVGFDSSDALTGYLADGTISGLIVQDPYQIGYQGVKAAFEASQGKGVLGYIDTGANLITRDNMNEVKEQQLLNPALD